MFLSAPEQPKTHSAVVVSRWLPGLMHASTDFLLPALTGSDLVMQSYRKKSSEPLTDSDISQRRMLSGSFGRINTSRKIWLYNNVDEIFCSSGHCFY